MSFLLQIISACISADRTYGVDRFRNTKHMFCNSYVAAPNRWVPWRLPVVMRLPFSDAVRRGAFSETLFVVALISFAASVGLAVFRYLVNATASLFRYSPCAKFCFCLRFSSELLQPRVQFLCSSTKRGCRYIFRT